MYTFTKIAPLFGAGRGLKPRRCSAPRCRSRSAGRAESPPSESPFFGSVSFSGAAEFTAESPRERSDDRHNAEGFGELLEGLHVAALLGFIEIPDELGRKIPR